MKTFRTLTILICLFLITITPSISSVTVPQPPNPTLGPAALNGGPNYLKARWLFGSIIGNDPDFQYGLNPSIAIHPANGIPYVSFYEQANNDLWWAVYVQTGGNCGLKNDWRCEVIDSTGDVGLESSIAIYKSSFIFGNKIGIAYLDSTNHALKLAINAYNISSRHYEWTITTVHQEAGIMGGYYPTLKFDSSGTPHIAYQVTDPTDGNQDGLWYATPYTGNFFGNCGADADWTCTKIDWGKYMGVGASMDLTYEDQPRIAYLDNTNHVLKYAYPTANNTGNCGPNGTAWLCYVIDTLPSGTNHLSLYAHKSATDDPRVAYYVQNDGAQTGTLKYAKFNDNGDGNCGAWSGKNWWNCSIIDDQTGYQMFGVSMAVDAGGNAIIAYQKKTNYGTALYFATYSSFGNCGPLVGIPPYTWHSWSCRKVGEESFAVLGGMAPSVAVNSAGLAYIASFSGEANAGSLDISYQQLLTFMPAAFRPAP